MEHAYLDFGGPNQEPLGTVTTDEMREYLDAGEFAEGSMKPKVEATVDFVEAGGDRAIITSAERIDDAIAGDAGTQVIPT